MFLDQSRLAVSVMRRYPCHSEQLTVGSIPTTGSWRIICGDRMTIHKLASVIGVVSRLLKPYRKVVIIEPFFNKPRIPASL